MPSSASRWAVPSPLGDSGGKAGDSLREAATAWGSPGFAGLVAWVSQEAWDSPAGSTGLHYAGGLGWRGSALVGKPVAAPGICGVLGSRYARPPHLALAIFSAPAYDQG